MGLKFLAAQALVVLSIVTLSLSVAGLFSIVAYTFRKRIAVQVFDEQVVVLCIMVVISFCTLVAFTSWG